jgi:hypothetical protein
MPLLHSLARPPCGFKADRHDLSCHIRWAHLVSALVHHGDGIDLSMVIDDGFSCAHCAWQCCCCLLLPVATAPSSEACIVFAAKHFFLVY